MLEMFCGTKSIGKEFEKVGFDVVSMDVDPRFNPTICADILDIDPTSLPTFDALWASFPCTAFSVAVIGRNWNHDNTPKNDSTRLGLRILEKTVAIVRDQERRNPKLKWWMENPRGKARKMEVVQDFRRVTVTYCAYGDSRMKPTDIWTNTSWTPRVMCKNGDSCHESAPRGSKTGTQGLKSAKDRSVIPAELCREIAMYAAGERVVRTYQPRLFQQELFA